MRQTDFYGSWCYPNYGCSDQCNTVEYYPQVKHLQRNYKIKQYKEKQF